LILRASLFTFIAWRSVSTFYSHTPVAKLVFRKPKHLVWAYIMVAETPNTSPVLPAAKGVSIIAIL